MTQLPQRPRRRLLTPVSGGLMVVIIAAGGFAAGAELQKSRGETTTNERPAGFAGGMPTGGPPGAAGGQSTDATVGTVTYTKGNTLYVKNADGNTVKVKLKSSADVTRTSSTDAGKIQPGDAVTVQGAANQNGTVTATTITATQPEDDA